MIDYLPIKDAALKLGMRESALLRRVQRGSVIGIKVGWIWVIHIDEVNRLLSERVAAQ